MFAKRVHLSVAMLVAVLATIALPVAGASAAEGGQLVLSTSSLQSTTHLGGGFSFQASVRNSGDTPLSDVVVTFVLPEGVTETYNEGSYSDGDNVDETQVGQVLTYFFPTLQPGSDARVGSAWVDAVLDEGADFGATVTARVAAHSLDTARPTIVTHNVCADDLTNACIVAEVVPGPRLTLSLTADVASALPGDTVRFSVEVSNVGVVDATAILIGVLPPELVFESSDVLVPSEYTDPAEGASFFDTVAVAAGETLGFGVVSTLGDVPLGTVVSFDLTLVGAGIVDAVDPCSDGSDSWDENGSRACAEVAVARRTLASPPVPRPGRPSGAAVPAPVAAALPIDPAAEPPADPGAVAAAAGAAPRSPAARFAVTDSDAARMLADTGGAAAIAPLGAALAALTLGSLLLACRDVGSSRRRVSDRG